MQEKTDEQTEIPRRWYQVSHEGAFPGTTTTTYAMRCPNGLMLRVETRSAMGDIRESMSFIPGAALADFGVDEFAEFAHQEEWERELRQIHAPWTPPELTDDDAQSGAPDAGEPESRISVLLGWSYIFMCIVAPLVIGTAVLVAKCSGAL